MNNQKMRRWTIVFRALSNINRLKTVQMLSAGHPMDVTEIAENLHISLKATSNHLAILKNLDVLESQGTAGHVFYSIHSQMPEDIRQTIDLL